MISSANSPLILDIETIGDIIQQEVHISDSIGGFTNSVLEVVCPCAEGVSNPNQTP